MLDEVMPVLTLPEGTMRPGIFARALGLAERLYDPLWKYITKVNSSVYPKSVAPGEISSEGVKLEADGGVPAYVDFASETLFVGRKVTVPFSQVTGLVAAKGLLAGETSSAFDLLVRLKDCDQYLPLHRFSKNEDVLPMVLKLRSEMIAPIGMFIKPFYIALEPGARHLLYEGGRIRLSGIRGILTSRRPDGETSVSLFHDGGREALLCTLDPDESMEQLGILVDELLAAAMRKNETQGSILNGLPQ